MVSGWTSLSQARCCGVRRDSAAVVAVRRACVTVEFGDDGTPDRGEWRNRDHRSTTDPPGPRSGYEQARRSTNCPHSYPQMWTGQSSSSRSTSGSVSGSSQSSRSWAAATSRHPRSLSAPLRSKRHWQKLTGFSPGANSSATLRRSGLRCRSGVTVVTAVHVRRFGPDGRFDQGNLVSTLEQSPERGDTAATGFSGTAPVTSETQSLPTAAAFAGHAQIVCERSWTARRNEERQPWPRASGPFSRTTGAGRGCTVSGCGCAPAPAAPSCPAGAARVVVH